MPWTNLPNLLTLSRLLSIPVLMGLIVIRVPHHDELAARVLDLMANSELRHVAEKVDHPLSAGHNPGHAAEAGIQFGLVGFPLGRGQYGRSFATWLGVKIGQHHFSSDPLMIVESTLCHIQRGQSISVNV